MNDGEVNKSMNNIYGRMEDLLYKMIDNPSDQDVMALASHVIVYDLLYEIRENNGDIPT